MPNSSNRRPKKPQVRNANNKNNTNKKIRTNKNIKGKKKKGINPKIKYLLIKKSEYQKHKKFKAKANVAKNTT